MNLLHIGEVRAAGLKPSTLQRTIEQTYIAREIYTRPTVTVTTNDSASTAQMVYVAVSYTHLDVYKRQVRVAVEKDPSKVLMVVEDALVINEGCAADIVKTAIIASKADPAFAAQIVKTVESVAPKMAGVINDAAAVSYTHLDVYKRQSLQAVYHFLFLGQ